MTTTLTRWLGLTAICATLAACGGGGGHGNKDAAEMPSAATGDFSATNFATAADAVAQTLQNSATSGADVADLVPLSATSSASHAAPRTALDLAVQAARDLVSSHGREQAQAVKTVDQPCDSGSLHYSLNYASESQPQPGDTLTISSNSCIFGGEAFGGSARMVIQQYASNDSSGSVRFTITFTDFGTAQKHYSGQAALYVQSLSSSDLVAIEFQGLAVSSGSTQVRWYHTVAVESTSGTTVATTLSYGGFYQGPNGFIRVEQVTPFVITSGNPASGTLRITDAQGDRVDISADGTRMHYQYFAAGNTSGAPNAAADGPFFVN